MKKDLESPPPQAGLKDLQAPVAANENKGSLRFGAPIENAQSVALADVAKDPRKFQNATFVTTGTVTAVCQHKGCWMELKDNASAAHIKMSGHNFFVPKNASGKTARVMAKLVQSDEKAMCADGDHAGAKGAKGCKEEAEQQLGRPLAKLELEATGVELVD